LDTDVDGIFIVTLFCDKDMLIVDKLVRGENLGAENVSCWQSVKLDLPGLERYDPSLRWAYKERVVGSIATYVFLYIDDGRQTADTT